MINKGRRKGDPWRRSAGGRGGGAKLETVKRGCWKKYQPRHVFVLVQRYMEKDAECTSHWFDMEPGSGLECLLIVRETSSDSTS